MGFSYFVHTGLRQIPSISGRQLSFTLFLCLKDTLLQSIIMAKFIHETELNFEVENIFKNAEETLILISPYIKLHERFISVLKTKLKNYNLKIFIVFGKNEQDMGKSLRKEDLDFFKTFPNIEIRYEKRLHAKYYANERSARISSMNSYSYSQDNNIEVGLLADINAT